MRCRYALIPVLALTCMMQALSNNIQVSNVALTGQNAGANTYQVKFDISWENSWRTSTFESNYDAAWIFVKYRVTPGVIWDHATISTTGNVAPTGGTVHVPSDGVGAFLYRNTNGMGNVNYTNVELRWNYGTAFPDDAILEICVFAIEMVYVPQGAFLAGDATLSPHGAFQTGDVNNPFNITSEASLTLGGTSTSNLSNNNNAGMTTADDFNYTTTQTLPAAYPKGFNALFVMKYEISQGQYADFLNKLTNAQATPRFPGFNGSNQHTINNTGVPPNIYVAGSPDRACNYLGWADVAAYADWSGLRPMSELEFEKICRGTRPAAPDEYAWGTPWVFNQAYTYANSGMPNEVATNAATGSGNAIYITTRGTSGPRKCGLAAASVVTPTRQEAGATYYGVMEMSGNVWETTVSLGSAAGRAFVANHGNGIINSLGQSTVGGWPSVTTGAGTGVRGGGHPNSTDRLRISSRDLSNINVLTRFSDVGGRLVRSLL